MEIGLMFIVVGIILLIFGFALRKEWTETFCKYSLVFLNSKILKMHYFDALSIQTRYL
jgi:hypothetical protein